VLFNRGSSLLPVTAAAPGPAPVKSNPWLQHAAGGQHRIEAHISGFQFAPHRHDTYAVALTLEGVQCFDYRGSVRHSLAGGVVVIHPDERHDGRPGTSDGFRYRCIHIEPARIQAMLCGSGLPFIAGGISTDPRLIRPVRALLADYRQPLGDLELDDALFDLSTALAALSMPRRRTKPIDHGAAERAREYMIEHWNSDVSLACLQRASGRDRWKLSRDFRVLYGTSPYRYLLMRRLERARELLADGHTLAEAAASCCFADQSHFTRHFRNAFGVTPGKWVRPA
jgi:AraC-like DNA-binding protein